MGFRGAAQGFRGTAPWGFEGQHHGVSRGSNKWDGTSRGSRGTSRHSNMGHGDQGNIFDISVQQISKPSPIGVSSNGVNPNDLFICPNGGLSIRLVQLGLVHFQLGY